MRITLDRTGRLMELMERREVFRWYSDLVGDLTLGVSIGDIMMIANSKGETRGADLSASKKRHKKQGLHPFLFPTCAECPYLCGDGN
jgi:hypothetical protein